MNFKFWDNEDAGHRGHGCHGREFRGRQWGRGWDRDRSGGNPFGGNPFERSERLFDQGDLRYVILHLVAERPRHGYEIIKAIEEGTGGSYSPSPGVVYPTLTMLEEMGLANVATTEGSKKLYTITDEGQRLLAENRAKVEQLLERMKHINDRFTAGGLMRVMKALHNLKDVAKQVAKRRNLTDEHARIVAEALDEAARKIQQL